MGENEELKALKCPDCGGNLAKSYRIDYEDDEDGEEIPIVKCPGCGKEYDQYSQEYYEFFADELTEDKGNSMLSLGLKGKLDDVEYEVIGRLIIQEEDEYEKSTWSEWLAVSSDGVYHYFVEEDGEFHSFEEYIPESIDLESDSDYIEFEGKKISKSDSYIGRIVHFEGELTWQPEIGEPVTCYDFKKDGYKISIEQSEGEVSITRGEKISYGKIIDAFNLESFKDQYDSTIAARKNFSRKAYVYLAGFILSFSLMSYNCASDKPLEKIMVNGIKYADNMYKTEKGKGAYFSQVVYGPFNIPDKNKLYEVKIFIDERMQSLNSEWQSVRLMLVKEDKLKKVIGDDLMKANYKSFSEIDEKAFESYSITVDFWDEHGYDSDGSWHESDVSASSNFVIDESGSYYAYLEFYNNKKRSKLTAVKVKISRVESVRYYLIGMIIFFVLFFLNRSKSNSYNELPFEMGSE